MGDEDDVLLTGGSITYSRSLAGARRSYRAGCGLSTAVPSSSCGSSSNGVDIEELLLPPDDVVVMSKGYGDPIARVDGRRGRTAGSRAVGILATG